MSDLRKAYSYLRFSTPEQSQSDSRRRQTEMAERYAAAHGLELDTELTFRDLGVSAFRGRNAETGGLAAFLEAVGQGMVEPGSVLLVENLDRLSRDAIVEAQTLFLNIITSGITLVTLNDGRAYSRETVNQSPMDMMYAILGFIRANEESATKSRRLRAVWDAKRSTASDRPMTSTAPAWLELVTSRQPDGSIKQEWRVIEERADVIRWIFDQTLRGAGQNAIAKRLNEQGVPTWGKAEYWHRSYVAKILDNPAVIGTLTTYRLDYSSGKRRREPVGEIPGYYPAVVPEETFRRVQAMPAAPAPKTSEPRNILGGGLAKCADCGATMVLVNKGGRSRGPRLVCARGKAGAGCAYRSVLYERVEKALVQQIEQAAARAPAGSDQLDAAFEEIEKQIGGYEVAIGDLLDAHRQHGWSPAISERLRGYESELEDLRRRRRGLETQAQIGAAGAVGKRLRALVTTLRPPDGGLDVQAANTALRQACSEVVVDPDEGSIELCWAHGGSSMVSFGMPKADVAQAEGGAIVDRVDRSRSKSGVGS